MQNIPVPSDAVADDGPTGDQIRWESAPASLTSGNYRVHVVNPPPGYRVVPDQVLVPGLPPMRFDISPTSDTPIDLGDIQADRYPWVEGTVLAPQLSAGVVSFIPSDAAGLTVALTCPGTDGEDDTVVLDQPRPLPPPGTVVVLPGLEDRGGGGALDSYFFDHVTLESNDLSGACTLTVNAAGYEPAVVPVPVEPGDGTSHARIFRNVAMIRPENVGGTAYWVDDGVSPEVRVDAIGVTVHTQDRPIIAFEGGTTERPQPGSDPTPVRAGTSLVQTTGDGGGWAFVDPRQVFGSTDYVFSAPGRFEDRIIRIRLDQAGRVVTPVTPAAGLELDDSAAAIAVELDAVGGPIDAAITIHTIKGTPSFPASRGGVANIAGFQMTLTGATAAGPVAAVPNGRNTGIARFISPDPGSYVAAMIVPPNHRPFDGLPQSGISLDFQNPGQAIGFARTYVELGRVDVQVVDTRDQPVPGVALQLTHVPSTFPPGDPPASTRRCGGPGPPPEPACSSPTTTFTELEVNSAAPDGQPVSYVVTPTEQSLNEAGFDLASGTVVITREDGVETRCLVAVCGAAANVAVRAGGQPTVRYIVPAFGRIDGVVVGDVDGNATGPTQPLTLTSVPPLEVTAQRVLDENCTVLTTPDDPVDAFATPGNPNGFSISGPPGYYTIEVDHPNFDPPDSTPLPTTDLCGEIPFQSPPPIQPVYRMRNLTIRTPVLSWVLPIIAGDLEVTVLNDTTAGTPVDAASVLVEGLDGTDVATVPTGTTGIALIPDLLPGSYRVSVTKTGPLGEAIYFPVIFGISVGFGGDQIDATVPFPRIGGAIVGSVGAVNSEGDLVCDPLCDVVVAPVDVAITRAYDAPDVIVDGALVPNQSLTTGGPAVTVTPPVAPSTGAPHTYESRGIPTGLHTLTFSDESPTYTTPPAAEVTVVGFTPVPAPVRNYVAVDRTVVVTVRTDPAGLAVGAVVRLTHADGDDEPRTIAAGDCSDAPQVCTIEFTGVAPELTAYQVSVTKALFTTFTGSVAVAPGDPTVDIEVPLVTLAGSVARIDGFAEQRDADPPAGQAPLGSGGTVQLFTAPDTGSPVLVATEDSIGTNGAFSFDITDRGPYRVRVSRPGTPGYATRESAVFRIDRGPAGVIDLGQTHLLPTIVVPRRATVTVLVTGPDGATVTGTNLATGPGTPTISAPTRSGSTFTFLVDPGFSHQFRFTSTAGYLPITVPDPAQAFPTGANPAPDPNFTAAMEPRTIGGTVSAAGPSPGATVRATQNGTTAVGDSVTTTGNFTLPGPFPAGPYMIVAERLGFGRATAAVSVADVNAGNVDVTTPLALSARTVNVTFASLPPGATIVVTRSDGGIERGTTAAAIPVPENLFPISYVASLAGHQDVSATGVQLDVSGTTWTQPGPLAMTVPTIPLPTTTTTTTTTTTLPPTTTTSTTTTTTTTSTTTTTTTMT